jgi:hypothetical protein
MSDGNTYESPIVHAIDGEEGAEMLDEVRASCRTTHCAAGIAHGPHAPNPCTMPTEDWCAPTANWCSVSYTF